jgi:hypothetical protein
MNSRRFAQKLNHLFAAGIACMFLTVAATAQVQTETSVTHGKATETVKVERGEVAYVSGNDLVIKKADGSLVHFPNVPDSARATVDGKELGIHDLKPGMQLERTTITSTTPMTVKTVETVSGTVWHVNPPRSVILAMDNGKHQQFKIPEGQKMTVNGQLTDAWGLKKGMRVSATRVVETPQTQVSEQTKVTGTAPIPPAADEPILFAMFVPAPLALAAAPATLPATGSWLPVFGLLGVLSVAFSLGLKATRYGA